MNLSTFLIRHLLRISQKDEIVSVVGVLDFQHNCQHLLDAAEPRLVSFGPFFQAQHHYRKLGKSRSRIMRT